MKGRMPILPFVFPLIAPFLCTGTVSATETGNTAPQEEVSQLTPLETYPRSPLPPIISAPVVPPSPQTPPASPSIPESRGAFNPRTGERYLPSGRGVYNPTTGEYYPPSGNGYINPRNGEYYPPVDHSHP